MSADPSPLAATSWSFDVGGGRELAAAVSSLLQTLGSPPELLALGEPTHGEPAFPSLRNRILEVLVEHGFRSIAIESDAVAALAVDTFVRGGGGALDSAMAEGFSHGLGRLDANRELVAWLRAHNDSLPAAERLAFYGFDAPLEMASAPSPRPYLEHLHDYLAGHLGPGSLLHGRDELEDRLGDDERWSDPGAQMDAGKSVGSSADAAALRVIADDLMTALHAQAPRLVAASSLADWWRAEVHARTALGLLRYHAQAADTAPQAERTSRMLGVRDALMAESLLAIRAREQQRGPTLVFAHNRHLQRHASTWRLADMDLEWSSAGAIVATLLGDRCAFVAGSLGASDTLGLHTPAPDTFEGALGETTHGYALVPATRLVAALDRELHTRTDVTAEQGYFPLDAATLGHCDAVLHVAPSPARRGDPSQAAAPTVAEVAARILALPDVTGVEADERSGAPETSWGDRFFFVGPDRMRPFATIVRHDTPGFDEDSRLDRPGVFRLNVELGREAFARAFGYPPAAFKNRRPGSDFSRLDEILPHPAYGTQGWACILSPSTRRLPDIDRLLAHAHRRALDRHRRATDGRPRGRVEPAS